MQFFCHFLNEGHQFKTCLSNNLKTFCFDRLVPGLTVMYVAVKATVVLCKMAKNIFNCCSSNIIKLMSYILLLI